MGLKVVSNAYVEKIIWIWAVVVETGERQDQALSRLKTVSTEVSRSTNKYFQMAPLQHSQKNSKTLL